MKRTLVLACVFLCLVGVLLPATELLAFSARETVVAHGALDTSGNRIIVAQSSSGLIVAYQGADGRIHVARSRDNKRWTDQVVDGSQGSSLQGLAALDQQVVLGYGKDGRLYSISSTDGGNTFSKSVAVISSPQSASIQDMAIDANGTIHIMFHRHDRYWDYNYARSTDGGRTYQVFLDFTKSTDSNSTGYSGNLRVAHGNLYTVYQDNNDDYAVKLSVSKDGGNSWETTRIAPSSGGRLGLAVDPMDPNLLYIAAYNRDGLTILRVKQATSSSPEFWPVYGDGTIKDDAKAVVSVHIAVASDRTAAVVYMNPITGSYSLLTSKNLGETWERGLLTSLIDPTNFMWTADLESFSNEFFFAHTDGEGAVILHGPEWNGQSATLPTAQSGVLTPNAQGLVELADTTNPFGVLLTNAMPMVMFSVPETGTYTINHLTQASIPLYISLYDLTGSADEVLDENYDGIDLFSSFRLDLKETSVYLLALGVLDEGDLGKTARLEISGNSVAKISTPPIETPKPMPTVVKTETEGDRVIAGQFNSFVLTEGGMVLAAGFNAYGHMADGGTESKKAFAPIRSAIADLAVGFGHTLFITDSHILYGSGRNEDNQIVSGTRANQFSMQRIADNVISAAGGYGHTLYVQSDGSVWAFGANNAGQLGDGTTTAQQKPVKIFERGEKVFANSAHTSFILTEDGDLYGFGNNAYGQLGLGHTNQVNKPTLITGNVQSVAVGTNHTVMLDRDGKVLVTGDNSQGQLGAIQATNRFVRVVSGIADIAAGNYSTWLLYPSGTLQAAGSNKYGQFGIGTNSSESKSVGFITVLEDVADIDVGRDHAVVLKEDGSVWTSGLNESYQLGDSTQGFRRDWKQVVQL